MTLKRKFLFTCWNEKCEHHDQEVEYIDDKDRFRFTVLSNDCPKCFALGQLRVVHGDLETRTSNEFFATVNGMVAEHKLLKKLIAKGVADPEDQVRHDEIVAAIGDLDCPHCSQAVLSHQH